MISNTRLGELRRLLHDIIVSEINAKWDLFWHHAGPYLRRTNVSAVLDSEYKPVFRRTEYSVEGRPPFIDILTILLREDCGSVVPVGVEVKVTAKLRREQLKREVMYLPNFTARNYLNRENFIKRWLAPHCGERRPTTNKRIYILITPLAIVKDADALIREVKQALDKSGLGFSYKEPAYVHTVIPLEVVLDWLSIKKDLEELLDTWGSMTPALKGRV
jgi:hypothetical protein